MYEEEKTMAQLLEEVTVLRQQIAALKILEAARTQAEAALRQAKDAAETAERVKSEFIATLSHELRTPLSVVLGYTDLLLEGEFGAVTTEQQEVLRRVEQNARELLDLISALLDLSRLDAGRLPVEFKEVGIPELLKVVERETQGLLNQSRVALVWQVEGNLPPVRTDAGKLKMVIKNLIGNALKFTKEGSIIVGTQRHAEGIEIRVADTGIGIPKEALPVIFEPFQQLDPSSAQGTGLGLHIVKRLLELLGGTITVNSEVGRGSTFCVWVPTQEGPPSPAGDPLQLPTVVRTL
jgi:signal transduction histidine kinase